MADSGGPESTNLRSPSPSSTGISWNAFDANERTDLAPSHEQQSVFLIAQALLERLDDQSFGSEDENDERSDDGQDFEPGESTVVSLMFPSLAYREPFLILLDNLNIDEYDEPPENYSRKRARTDDLSAISQDWFPWADKL